MAAMEPLRKQPPARIMLLIGIVIVLLGSSQLASTIPTQSTVSPTRSSIVVDLPSASAVTYDTGDFVDVTQRQLLGTTDTDREGEDAGVNAAMAVSVESAPGASPGACTVPQYKTGPDGFVSTWLRNGVHAPPGEAPMIDKGRVRRPFRFHVYDIPRKYIDGALKLLEERWSTSFCNRGKKKSNYTMLDWRHAHSLFTADVFMSRHLRYHPQHTNNPDHADVFIIPMMTHLYNCAGTMHYAIEILNWVIQERGVYYKRMNQRDHFLFWWRWGMHFGSTNKLWKRISAHYPNVNFISFDYLELQGRNNFQDFTLALKPKFATAQNWIVVPYPDFSPALSVAVPKERIHDKKDIFFFFAGTSTIGGIRRWIKRACEANKDDCLFWDFGGSVIDTKRLSVPDYPTATLKSTFCGHAAGDALSSRRPTSAVLAGCIPVLICDLCLYAWENIIDYSAFSVFVHEEDVINGKLFEILRKIPQERIRQMQTNLALVRDHFVYNTSGPPAAGDALDTLVQQLSLRGLLLRQYRRWHAMNAHLSTEMRDYPADPCPMKRYIRKGITSKQEEDDFNNIAGDLAAMRRKK
jgi:hypothetical protein